MPRSSTETRDTIQRKHWSLAVLSLLRERPMHPYEIKKQMEERHKVDRLVLKAGSLYNAIAWLLKDGLIRVQETKQVGNRPHRTIYQISAHGAKALASWLGEMLAEPRLEPSSFSVALDHLAQLEPETALTHLAACREQLQQRGSEMEATIRHLTGQLGRISFIEIEHDLALCRAEVAWVDRVLGDLKTGALTWNAVGRKPRTKMKKR